MLYDELIAVLSRLRGASFASLDAETVPFLGCKKFTTNNRVLLFSNVSSSGYEKMVRRRLVSAGKNPDNFVVSDLPWGERVDDLPIILHKDKYYLQTILLAEGSSRCFLGSSEVDCSRLNLPKHSRQRGLAASDAVVVNTYLIENIREIRLLGVTLPEE